MKFSMGTASAAIGIAVVLVGGLSTATRWAYDVDDHIQDSEILLADADARDQKLEKSVEALENYVEAAEARAEAEKQQELRIEKMCASGEIDDRSFCRKRGYNVPNGE